jgi:hypothetical protein
MICPKRNRTDLQEDLDLVLKNAITADVKENGIENIIIRELANHESYYTGSIEQTVAALASYEIAPGEILRIFKQEIPKHYND